MTNQEIARILQEMSELLAIENVPFKPRAYERASLGISGLNREVKDVYEKEGMKGLQEIPGVGKGIAEHIRELFEKGTFKEYEQLKKKAPAEFAELMEIEGVGPHMVKTIWEKLKIRNVAELETAAKEGKLRKLPRFGEKTERRILQAIEFYKSSGTRRILGFILPELRSLEGLIRSFESVDEAVIAGSVRRRKETIGDIDILAASSQPEDVIERFLGLPFVAHVYDKGPTKVNVRLKNGLDADLRVVPRESFGAALSYVTGSREHTLALRELAIRKGLKLNEYGLYKGEKLRAGKTEDELYNALGLAYIDPEIRENTGEIETSKKGTLPNLIGYDELKGDLQVQTDWTDGEASIEQMAHAAEKAGLDYIVITDHTKSLAMTGGADEKKLRRQMQEIDKLNEKLHKEGKRIKVLKGAEVNIMKDGSLDIDDDALAELDVVGASVHSHFGLNREEQMKRMVRAMENPHVDIMFHLTGRKINKRKPIDLDIDAIIETAKRTGTVLEINAYPDRLDIKDDYIRRCVEKGIKMSIDSDAHATSHFKYLEVGIAQARRGWAEKKDIINAWPMEKMLSFLKDARRKR